MSSTASPPPAATSGSGGPAAGGVSPEPADHAGAPPPAPEACPLCGTPLRPDQEWCLHCGAAARTRLATSSNWRAPIIAVAVVAILALGVLAASLVSLAGNSGSSSVVRRTVTTALAGTPTTPAAAAAAPAATGATATSAGATAGAGSTGATTPAASTPTATSPAVASPGTASGPLSTKPTVTPPSGPPPTRVDIKEIVTGTGAEAHAPESVTVNYVGVLYKGGAEFDSSWRRGKRFTFTLGTNQVISGWDEGVSGMKVGGRRELIVPASFAYGANGLATQPTAIPPNEALVFVVDLLSA